MSRKGNNRRKFGTSEKISEWTNLMVKVKITIHLILCTMYKEEILKLHLKRGKGKDTRMTVNFLHFYQNGTTLILVDYDVS